MVRIGIGLYGHWGSKELKDWAGDKLKLLQVATWKTIIAEIKDKPKGSFIGYNLRNQLQRDSKIAILPIGYWHGLTGILSEQGEVLINGKRVPILGRVSMDMSIVDATDAGDVKYGGEVVIVGKQEGEFITTDELKYRFDLLNYEFLTRINADIPRIYK
jgi:alanine racemase